MERKLVFLFMKKGMDSEIYLDSKSHQCRNRIWGCYPSIDVYSCLFKVTVPIGDIGVPSTLRKQRVTLAILDRQAFRSAFGVYYDNDHFSLVNILISRNHQFFRGCLRTVNSCHFRTYPDHAGSDETCIITQGPQLF